jgi:hypothetical protein
MRAACDRATAGMALRLAVLLLPLAFAAPARAGQFEDGFAAYDRGDYATAFKDWFPLAMKGDAPAENNLGFLYDQGRGVPQDFAKAAGWYEKAAEQGDAPAGYNIGLDYAQGHGVLKDYAKAYIWLNLAAARLEPASSPQDVSPEDLVKMVHPDTRLFTMEDINAMAKQPVTQFERQFNSGNPPTIITPQSAETSSFEQQQASFEAARDYIAKLLRPEDLAKAQELAGAWQPKTQSPQ